MVSSNPKHWNISLFFASLHPPLGVGAAVPDSKWTAKKWKRSRSVEVCDQRPVLIFMRPAHLVLNFGPHCFIAIGGYPRNIDTQFLIISMAHILPASYCFFPHDDFVRSALRTGTQYRSKRPQFERPCFSAIFVVVFTFVAHGTPFFEHTREVTGLISKDFERCTMKVPSSLQPTRVVLPVVPLLGTPPLTNQRGHKQSHYQTLKYIRSHSSSKTW